jgi:hypothetical protein
MPRWFWIVCLFAACAFVRFDYFAQGQAPVAASTGALAVLTRGQHVGVQDSGGRFEINAFPGSGVFFGSEVVDVGSDFVVLRDLTGVTEMRIPVTSIKAVITGRGKQR